MSELKRPASPIPPGSPSSGPSAEKKQKTVSERESDVKSVDQDVASNIDNAHSSPPASSAHINTKPPLERLRPANETLPQPISKMGLEPAIPVMPPSLELITGVKADLRASKGHIGQEEVGIIGYVGGNLAALQGVIKQR